MECDHGKTQSETHHRDPALHEDTKQHGSCRRGRGSDHEAQVRRNRTQVAAVRTTDDRWRKRHGQDAGRETSVKAAEQSCVEVNKEELNRFQMVNDLESNWKKDR